MKGKASTLAPGARVFVRDAEWLVRKVDRTSTGGQAFTVVGIWELVRDKEAIFLTEVEPSIEILDPAKTELVRDASSSHQASLLYMESLLRQAPPTDENLYLGHRAAMDAVPYQVDPAIQALKQPRQRILIADAVGLGKSLEAGILLSERRSGICSRSAEKVSSLERKNSIPNSAPSSTKPPSTAATGRRITKPLGPNSNGALMPGNCGINDDLLERRAQSLEISPQG